MPTGANRPLTRLNGLHNAPVTPQIPLERQSPGSLFPATKKDGKISRLSQYNKTSCLFFHPSRNELPSRGLPHQSKVFEEEGMGFGEGEGKLSIERFPSPSPINTIPLLGLARVHDFDVRELLVLKDHFLIM